MRAVRFAEGTKVSVESSRGEIGGILTKHGCMRMAWATEPRTTRGSGLHPETGWCRPTTIRGSATRATPRSPTSDSIRVWSLSGGTTRPT